MAIFWFPIDQPLGDRSPNFVTPRSPWSFRGSRCLWNGKPIQEDVAFCHISTLKNAAIFYRLVTVVCKKSRWFKMNFLSSKWRSLILWKGDLTIQKWSQRIARMVFLYSNLSFKQALSFKGRLHLTKKFVAKRGFKTKTVLSVDRCCSDNRLLSVCHDGALSSWDV